MAILIWGCSDEPVRDEFVARVGDEYLTHEDVVSAISAMPAALDSAHAARQVVDRWVRDELLAQEARSRSIQEDDEVKRRLQENERAVLISSLVDQLYEEVEPATEREIAAYFERNVGSLLLREPFLQVRYLTTSDSSAAVRAVAMLDTLASVENADSLWNAYVELQSEDVDASTIMSTSYFPSSRLFRNVPYLRDAVAPLAVGESVVVVANDSLFHVIQLADRVDAGTAPELDWIVEEIQNRLLIDKRKQLYTDQVQRLRNRALAEGRLEIRE